MRELLFLNPALNDGVNLTVRNGTKWADVTPGERLTVRRSYAELDGRAKDDEPAIATVTVLGAQVVNFADARSEPGINAALAFEHDPACRTFDGLLTAMERAYGEGQVSAEVTFVWFVHEGDQGGERAEIPHGQGGEFAQRDTQPVASA